MKVPTTRDPFTTQLFNELQALEDVGMVGPVGAQNAAAFILRNPEIFNVQNPVSLEDLVDLACDLVGA